MQKIRLEKEHEHPSRDIGTPPCGSFAQGLDTLQTSKQVPYVGGAGHAFVMVIDDSQTVRKIVEIWRGARGVRGEGLPQRSGGHTAS